MTSRAASIRNLVQIIMALCAMVLCVVAASLLPAPWQGISGRDFRPQATTMAVLLALLALFLRGKLRWRPANLVGALLIMEIAILLLISYFSGYGGRQLVNGFNLSWLLFLNIFVGLPWLAGLATGQLWIIIADRRRGAGP